MSTTRRVMSAMATCSTKSRPDTNAKARARRAFGDQRYLLDFFFVVVFLGLSAASFFGAAFFAGFFFGASSSSSSGSGLALAFFGAALAFLAGASSATSV